MRSNRADVLIADLDCLGKTLFHNRFERTSGATEESEICELMHTEKEGYAYNELVTHLPLHAVDKPRRVMVMGGGSLFTAREVLKHPSVVQVDVVDYDADITDMVVQHYDQSLARIRSDSRVRLHCDDIRNFLKAAPKNYYDVIIDDLIDVVRPADRWVLDLFPEIASTLKRRGLFSSYLYPSWYHANLNRRIISKLRRGGLDKIMVTDESIFTYSWPEGFTASEPLRAIDWTKRCRDPRAFD